MFSFQQFSAYQIAKTFYASLGVVIHDKSLPIYMRDQLGRAGLSIILNLAEGSGRDSIPDRNRFYSMAKGSVYECVAIIDILYNENSVNEDAFHAYNELASQIIKILIVTIKSR